MRKGLVMGHLEEDIKVNPFHSTSQPRLLGRIGCPMLNLHSNQYLSNPRRMTNVKVATPWPWFQFVNKDPSHLILVDPYGNLSAHLQPYLTRPGGCPASPLALIHTTLSTQL